MRDPSGHSLPRDNQGRWQQVQLSRGHWRREDAADAIRSAGWWESVTVTWSSAPAPDHRPAVLPRALAAATDMIAPVLADVAITSIRRLIQLGTAGFRSGPSCGASWSLRPGNLPGPTEHREGPVAAILDLTVCPGDLRRPSPAAITARRCDASGMMNSLR
jgi:hypothetical protein